MNLYLCLLLTIFCTLHQNSFSSSVRSDLTEVYSDPYESFFNEKVPSPPIRRPQRPRRPILKSKPSKVDVYSEPSTTKSRKNVIVLDKQRPSPSIRRPRRPRRPVLKAKPLEEPKKTKSVILPKQIKTKCGGKKCGKNGEKLNLGIFKPIKYEKTKKFQMKITIPNKKTKVIGYDNNKEPLTRIKYYENDLQPFIFPEPSGKCPNDWINFNHFCYKVLYVNATARYGERICRIQGGHLASIHSNEENEFLIRLTSTKEEPNPTEWTAHSWIGLVSKTSGPDFSWRWTDGTKTDYLAFGSGHLYKTFYGERCVTLMHEQKNEFGEIRRPGRRIFTGWNNLYCNWETKSIICKKKEL